MAFLKYRKKEFQQGRVEKVRKKELWGILDHMGIVAPWKALRLQTLSMGRARVGL